MGRQADGPPGEFARAVATEIRKEAGDKRLSGRRLAAILGKSEKYVRERINNTLSFALNDVEVFAAFVGIAPEVFIARIESTMLDNVTKGPWGVGGSGHAEPDMQAVAADEVDDDGEEGDS